MHTHGHHAAHTHGHGHGMRSTPLLLALGLTLGYAAVEAVAGWWAGSLALLGDAGHMLTDSFALALAAFAAWLAARPSGPRLTYGLGRVEEVSGVGESAMSLIDFGSAGRVKLMHNHAPVQKL